MTVGKLRTAALIFDSLGLAGSCIAKAYAVRTGDVAQSKQADLLIQKGIKNIKRDLGG